MSRLCAERGDVQRLLPVDPWATPAVKTRLKSEMSFECKGRLVKGEVDYPGRKMVISFSCSSSVDGAGGILRLISDALCLQDKVS